MPNWSQSPPKDATRSGFRLIRTPTTKPFTAHVINHAMSGCPTHFVGNRTVPCEQHECEACINGVPWRWHAYLLVIADATQETVIFECTAKTSESFAHYFKRFGTLRGCHFIAQRQNQKTNGRVLVQTKPGDLSRIELPPDQSVQKLLAHIWNIPENQIEEPARQTRPPTTDIAIDRTKPEIDTGPRKLTDKDRDFVLSNARSRNGNRRSTDPGTGV